MLKKFSLWLIVFGLSFFLETMEVAKQGNAFLIMYVGTTGIIITIGIIIDLIVGSKSEKRKKILKASILLYCISNITMLLIASLVTHLFNVDYFIAFQIITLGECLSNNLKLPKEDNHESF